MDEFQNNHAERKNSDKRVHIEQLHVYQVLRNANLCIMTESRTEVAWDGRGQRRAKGKDYKGT